MDDNGIGPARARERLAAWQAQLDEVAASGRAMSERMRSLRVTASDRDRLVEVTVGHTGALVGLRLSERMRRTAPSVVADTIMTTIEAAKVRLAEESDEIIATAMGTESAAAQALRDGVRRQLDQHQPTSSRPRQR